LPFYGAHVLLADTDGAILTIRGRCLLSHPLNSGQTVASMALEARGLRSLSVVRLGEAADALTTLSAHISSSNAFRSLILLLFLTSHNPSIPAKASSIAPLSKLLLLFTNPRASHPYVFPRLDGLVLR